MSRFYALAVTVALALAGCGGSSNPTCTGPSCHPSGTDGGTVDGSTVDGSSPDDGGIIEHGDGGSGATIKECATLAPLSSGTCSMTAGGAAMLISGDVLTPTNVLKGGQVLVDATGKIACVDCDCTAQAAGATTIVCPQAVISPGLINAHDHINFENQPQPDTGERYEQRNEWRKGLDGHKKITVGSYANGNQIAWQELRYLMGGATSTVGEGSAAGLVRNLTSTTRNQSLNQPAVNFDTFPLGDSDGTEISMGCGFPSIESSDTAAKYPAYLPHVSEGINDGAHNEFTCVSSNVSGAHDLTLPNTAFIHAVALKADDYATMAAAGTSMVWSSRTNVSLYGDTARTPVAARLGVRIAMGTDWTISGSMNMLRELQCADTWNSTYYDHYFTDKDLWTMATIGSAQVTAVDDAIGSIQPGLFADLAIFDASKHPLYRAVIDASPDDVALVMRGGRILYGDKSIIDVTADAANCDSIDVCGRTKSICLKTDTGQDLATLSAATTASYPLFFCDTPKNEPSCVPARKASVNGSTIYTGIASAEDSDGDGIPDTGDLCPSTFDPIRPMDGGKQADADNDGVGDACDPCPLNANTTTCTKVTPTGPIPKLVSLAPANAFVRVGANQSLPTALVVTLDSAPTADVAVTLASSDTTSLTVPATVTVPMGQTSAQIMVMGVKQAMSVTLTATLGAATLTSNVRVVAANEVAELTSLTPATIGAAQGKAITFTASLDIPAEVDKTITLSSTGGTLSATSITILKDQVSGTFTFTQDGNATNTITATDGTNPQTATVNLLQFPVINEIDYDQPGTDSAEYAELFNNTASTITLDGIEAVFVNGSSMPAKPYLTVPLTGTLASGAYLVLGVAAVTVPTGVTKIAITPATNAIQNGPNDALVLIQTSTGAVLDAVSWGGACNQMSVMGVSGTPACDEGMPTTAVDSNTAPGSLCRIPNGSDTDNNATDFVFCATSTPGAANMQ